MSSGAYGWAHRRTRTKLLAQAHTAELQGEPWICPRCGLPLLAWQPIDLGHSHPTRKTAGLPGDRLEHAGCNRSAQDGPTIVQPVGVTPSREW